MPDDRIEHAWRQYPGKRAGRDEALPATFTVGRQVAIDTPMEDEIRLHFSA